MNTDVSSPLTTPTLSFNNRTYELIRNKRNSIPPTLNILLIPMCIQTAIQSKIAELTNNGEHIATFLTDTMHGQSDHAIKIHHRIDAARLLAKYGIPQPNNITEFPSPSMEEGHDGDEENPTHPVIPGNSDPTLRDIVAYPVARYIRDRTNNGETLIDTLCHIMNGGHYNPDPFSGRPQHAIKPRERIAAARELLRRAFAEHNPISRHSRESGYPDDQNNIPSIPSIHVSSPIAALAREKTNNGIDAAEQLIRIVENDNDDEWQPAHRVAAAKELLHRAYDLNYDAVTWEHIDAYNRAANIGFDAEGAEIERARIQSARSDIIREFSDASAAGDEQAMQAAEDKFNAYNARVNNGEDPDEALEHAELGPNDPDPDIDYLYPPLSEKEQAQFYRELIQIQGDGANNSDNRSVANAIKIPKLTITLPEKSHPP